MNAADELPPGSEPAQPTEDVPPGSEPAPAPPTIADRLAKHSQDWQARVDAQAEAKNKADEETRLSAQYLRYRQQNGAVAPERQTRVFRAAAALQTMGEKPDLSFVDANLDDIEKRVEAHGAKWDEALRDHPGLKDYLAPKPERQDLIRDDMANTTGLAWALKVPFVWMPQKELAEQEYQARTFLESKFLSSASNEKRVSELEPEVNVGTYGAKHWYSKMYAGAINMAPMLLRYAGAGVAGGALGVSVAGPEAAAAAGATAEAAGAGGALVAGSAAVTGAKVATGALSYYETVGPAYKRLVDQGVRPEIAHPLAEAEAGINGAIFAGAMPGLLGKLGFGKAALDGIGKQTTEALIKAELPKILGDMTRKWGASVTHAALTMAALGAVSQTTNELGKEIQAGTALDLDPREAAPALKRIGSAAADSAVTAIRDMSLIAAFAPVREALGNMGEAARLAQDQEQLEQAFKATEQSKLLERSPDEFKAFIATLGQRGLKKLYSPIEAFNAYWEGRRANPRDIAAKLLGDDGQAYDHAVQTGGDLAMPVDNYLTVLGKTEHARALAQDLKIRPDGRTPRQEAKRIEARAAELAKIPDADVRMEEGRNLLEQRLRQDWERTLAGNKTIADPKAVAANNAKRTAESFHRWAEQTNAEANEGTQPVTAWDLFRQRLRLEMVGRKGVRSGDIAAEAYTAPSELARLEQFHTQEIDDAGRLSARYRDRNTGLLNERGASLREPDTDRPMTARFSLEAKKPANDESGHRSVDGALRIMARTLADAELRDGVKRGGGIEVDVRDQAHADELAAAMAKALDPSGRIKVFATAVERAGKPEETLAALGTLHDSREADAVKAGGFADRGQLPVGYKDAPLDFKRLAESWTPEALGDAEYHADLTDAHAKDFAGLDEQQRFSESYVDKHGLLTELGFHRTVELTEPAFVASADARGIKKLNEKFGRRHADTILDLLSDVFARKGGGDVNMAHLHGDEFGAASDSRDRLEDYFADVREVTDRMLVYGTNEQGRFVLLEGVHWAHGIGPDFDLADRVALRDAKLKQGAAPDPREFASREELDAEVKRLETAGFEGFDLDKLSRRVPDEARADVRRGEAQARIEPDRAGAEPGSAPGERRDDSGQGRGGVAGGDQAPTDASAPGPAGAGREADAGAAHGVGQDPGAAHLEVGGGKTVRGKTTGPVDSRTRDFAHSKWDAFSHIMESVGGVEASPSEQADGKYRKWKSEEPIPASKKADAREKANAKQRREEWLAKKPRPFPTGFEQVNKEIAGLSEKALRKAGIDPQRFGGVTGALEAFELLARTLHWETMRPAVDALRTVPGLERLSLPEQVEQRRLDAEWEKAAAEHHNVKLEQPRKRKPTAEKAAAPAQTDTPQFKAWFGDSKVVDKSGKPLRVFHGTVGDIERFDKARLGETTGANSAKSAFFFTDHADTAADYSEVGDGRTARDLNKEQQRLEKVARRTNRKEDWDRYYEAYQQYEDHVVGEQDAYRSRDMVGADGANVLPVYLRLANPLVKDFGGQKYREESYAELIDKARRAGHDGVIFKNTIDPGNPNNEDVVTVYAVFDPTQIKSATGNRGTFDPNDPNILRQPGRGSLSFTLPTGDGKPRRYTMNLDGADESTAAHETMHLLAEVMHDIATAPGAPETIRADYEALIKWMGHASPEERVAASKERIALESKPRPLTAADEKRRLELEAKEERVAVGWEEYLREGKSPSARLQDVFSRMAGWLAKIYRGSSPAQQFEANYGEALGLTPEVRAIFDRLLASEDQLDKTHSALEMQPLPAAHRAMTPQEQAEYAEATEKMQADAKADLLRELAADADEKGKVIQEEREKITEDVEIELDRQPAYRALSFLQDRELVVFNEETGEVSRADPPAWLVGEDGKTFRLDRKDIDRVYGKGAWKTLPAGTTTEKGGIGAGELADFLGFDGGEALVRALQVIEPRKKVVGREVQRRLTEKFGPSLLDSPEDLFERALAAEHNEAAAKRIILEIRALRRQLNPNHDPRLEALGEDRPGQSKRRTVEAAAKRLIEQRPVGELSPGYYRRAEQSAAKRAFEAAVAGDIEKAIGERETQLLNQYLYRFAREAKQEVENVREQLGKKTADTYRAALGRAVRKETLPDGTTVDHREYLDAHDALLAAVEIGQRKPEDFKLDDVLARMDVDAADIGFDPEIVRGLLENPKPFDDLTTPEVRELYAAVRNIRAAANATLEILMEGQRVTVKSIVAGIKDDLERLPFLGKAPADRALVSVTKRAELLVQGADGGLLDPLTFGDLLGPRWKAFALDRYYSAREKRDALENRVLGKVFDAWKALPKAMRDRRHETVAGLDADLPIPDELNLGGPRSRQWLWMAFLNMGNRGPKSNAERLTKPFGWTETQVEQALAKHLTPAECDFLQSVLTLSDKELWPEIAAKETRKTGLPPEKIQASPIRLTFADGTEKVYEGGYFPARYAKFASVGDIAERQAEGTIQSFYGPNYERATTPKSHTKARAAGYANTLDLDWSVVSNHLAQVVHDLAFDEYVRDTARVLMHPDLQTAIYQRLGEGRANQPTAWLKAVANAFADSVPESMRWWQRILNPLRNRTVAAAIGGSLPVALGDLANAPLSILYGDLHPLHGAAAIAKGFAESPKMLLGASEWRNEALRLSPELRHRDRHHEERRKLELASIGKKQSATGKAFDIARMMQFGLQEATDALSGTQIWWGVRNAAEAAGETTEAAIAKAEDAVRRALPARDVAEQSAALRDKRGLGSLLIFHGWFNKRYNMNRRAMIQAGDAVRDGGSQVWHTAVLAGRVLAGQALSGAASEFLSGRGKSNDESTWQWLLRKMAGDAISEVPFGGTAQPFVDYLLTGHYKPASVRGAPGLSIVEHAIDMVGKLASPERDTHKKLWDAIELALIGAGGPARQFRNTFEYLDALVHGRARDKSLSGIASGLTYGERENQPDNPAKVIGRLAK